MPAVDKQCPRFEDLPSTRCAHLAGRDVILRRTASETSTQSEAGCRVCRVRASDKSEKTATRTAVQITRSRMYSEPCVNRAERAARCRRCASLYCRSRLFPTRIPHLHGFVKAAADDPLPVWAESHAETMLVCPLSVSVSWPVSCIPDLHRSSRLPLTIRFPSGLKVTLPTLECVL